MVIKFHREDTRNMAALIAVIARTKANTSPEKYAGSIKGRVIFEKVLRESAPRSIAASSIEGSICRRMATPDSMPTGCT
jgi:hypothetical protein